ncbi:MAG TPA: hypothetical protein VE621_13230 [Bryobacteraceae bacterium]|nr:hypothetical protein [Bryobacteraceae bacterium]
MQIGPVDSLVGPGVELTNFADFLNVNFSDTNILMTATRNANALSSFELIRFFNVTGLIPVITDVTINPATNFTGFNASRITFDANLISVNLTALAGLQNQQISLNLSAVPRAPGPPPPPPPPPTPQAEIPEPGSAPLCAMGVVIIVTLAKGKI